MKIKLPRIKSNEILFFFSYIVFLVTSILATSFYYQYFDRFHNYIIIFCILLLIMQELLVRKIRSKELVVFLICALLCIISLRVSQGAMMRLIPCTFLYVFSARKSDINKIFIVTITVSVLMLLLIILSAYLGIITNYVSYRRLGNRSRREYLGFRYVLYPAGYISNVISLYIYLKKEKIKIFEIIMLFCLNYWCYAKTDSRLSFYLSSSILLYALVKHIGDRKKKKHSSSMITKIGKAVFGFFSSYSFVICAIFSIMLSALYTPTNPQLRAINEFFSNRLSLGKNALVTYGASLLGGRIQFVGFGLNSQGEMSVEQYNYVDSFYVQFLIRFGIVFMILLLCLLTYTQVKYRKSNDVYMMVLLSVMALHCIVDDLFMQLFFNGLWFAIGNIVLKQNESIKNSLDGNKRQKILNLR